MATILAVQGAVNKINHLSVLLNWLSVVRCAESTGQISGSKDVQKKLSSNTLDIATMKACR